jgi:hypothetical protein
MTPPCAPALLVLIPALTCSLAGTAFGQIVALQERLAKTTALECSFSTLATGSWENGTPGAKVAPAKFNVRFTGVNADEGTADAGGSLGGTSFIAVRYANGYLHLMQMHRDGPLYTTTVFAKETKDGRLMAVQTRHEHTQISLPGFTSRPEMYLGDCALGN